MTFNGSYDMFLWQQDFDKQVSQYLYFFYLIVKIRGVSSQPFKHFLLI